MYASSTKSKGYRDIEELQLSLLPYNLEGDSVTLGKHEFCSKSSLYQNEHDP